MTIRRVFPYLAGLIVLAFALASLSRGTSGGSLLFRAYWLLYLVELVPVIVLVVVIGLVVFIGLNYRNIGAGIGFGLAQRRKRSKKRSRYATPIAMLFWALFIGILITTKNSIFNAHLAGYNLTDIVGVNATAPSPIEAGGFVPAVSSLVQNSWFSIAFLGAIIVGGLIAVQSVWVAYKETQDMKILESQAKQEQGLQAVQEAIRLVDDSILDPRSRIIACYQHLISTVARLGAPISSNLTARELDRAVRTTFNLKGPEATDLTQLFEEARYSLHEITDDDATNAHHLLESVAEELKTQTEITP